VSELYTKFGSHLTENKLRVHYKDQPVNPVHSNWYWLCESHATHAYTVETLHKPILVAVRSGVGLRPLACWGCWFQSRRGHGFLLRVGVVCCQVEVSVICRSLVQRSPTGCGVSECDSEASITRRLWPTRGCCGNGEKKLYMLHTKGGTYQYHCFKQVTAPSKDLCFCIRVYPDQC